MTRWGTYHRRFVPLRDRFAELIVVAPNGCWMWAGAMDGSGYGMFQVGKRSRRAHAVSYELFVGEIPKGLQMDHLCRERGCVNWRHLEPVTQKENQSRSPYCIPTINEKKTHCKHGHPLSGDNLVMRPLKGKLTRACRACRRRYCAERLERLSKAAVPFVD